MSLLAALQNLMVLRWLVPERAAAIMSRSADGPRTKRKRPCGHAPCGTLRGVGDDALVLKEPFVLASGDGCRVTPGAAEKRRFQASCVVASTGLSLSVVESRF